jgi:hypothetical protein
MSDGTDYCTLVTFRSSFERGIEVDCKITKPWGAERALWDLMNMTATTEAEREALFNNATPQMGESINSLTHAMHGMSLRARFNTDMRGPFVIFTDTPPDEESLLLWVKAKLRG